VVYQELTVCGDVAHYAKDNIFLIISRISLSGNAKIYAKAYIHQN
jgi:hypothetical protein